MGTILALAPAALVALASMASAQAHSDGHTRQGTRGEGTVSQAEAAGHPAPVRPSAADADWKRYDLLVYGGKFNNAVFGRILFSQATDYRESYVRVVALNYELGAFVGPVTIEAEGQVASHTGIQTNHEINLLIIARHEWVWGTLFSFSLAIGDGFSLASEVPVLEKRDNAGTNAFLQYLMVEFDLGLVSVSGRPRVMMRIHHRSGAYGLHCAGTCGSNFVTYGLKWAF